MYPNLPMKVPAGLTTIGGGTAWMTSSAWIALAVVTLGMVVLAGWRLMPRKETD